jgi:Mu transposase, C-terminal domain
VDVDTIRYSVPHRLVRDQVEVVVEDQRVRIFHGTELVATHGRSTEPFARVVDVAHYAGLWRSALDDAPTPALALLGRDLADYAAVVDGGQ